MARTFFFVSVLLLPTTVFSQVRISASVGYATYAMDELKTHQYDLQSQFPVDVRATSSFPGYAYYQVGGNWAVTPNAMMGLSFTYGSTGGKIHYSDYSGEVGFEHKIKYFAIGIPVTYQKEFSNGKWKLQLEVSPTVNLGSTTFDVYLNVGSEQSDDRIDFKSRNFGFQPALRMERKVGPGFIFLEGGYYLDVSMSKLTVKDNDDYYLMNRHKAVHADFSGLRTAVGISYVLGK
jgi:hypothetical protein